MKKFISGFLAILMLMAVCSVCVSALCPDCIYGNYHKYGCSHDRYDSSDPTQGTCYVCGDNGMLRIDYSHSRFHCDTCGYVNNSVRSACTETHVGSCGRSICNIEPCDY